MPSTPPMESMVNFWGAGPPYAAWSGCWVPCSPRWTTFWSAAAFITIPAHMGQVLRQREAWPLLAMSSARSASVRGLNSLHPKSLATYRVIVGWFCYGRFRLSSNWPASTSMGTNLVCAQLLLWLAGEYWGGDMRGVGGFSGRPRLVIVDP